MLFNENLCQANCRGVGFSIGSRIESCQNRRADPREATKQQSSSKNKSKRKQYTEGSSLEVNRNLNIYELVLLSRSWNVIPR